MSNSKSLEVSEYLTNNADKIYKLSELIYEALNQVDYDPMNPNFRYLDDPVKDVFHGCAVKIFTDIYLGVNSTQETEHSVECKYQYALARLGLNDSRDLRVIFWDAMGALELDEKSDSYLNPEISGDCDLCESSSEGENNAMDN